MLRRASRLGGYVVRDFGMRVRRLYGQSSYTSHPSPLLSLFKATAVLGTTVGTGTLLLKSVEPATEGKPANALKLFYATRFRDEEERRRKGIVPTAFFKAAQHALSQNNPDLACQWFAKLVLVHPRTDERLMYHDAAKFLFEHNRIEEAVAIYELTYPEQLLEGLYEKAGDALQGLNKQKQAAHYWELAEQHSLNRFKDTTDYWKTVKYGSPSASLGLKLAQHYLTSSDEKHLYQAKDRLLSVVRWMPRDSARLNELGVVYFMIALTSRKPEKFYRQRVEAMICFEEAIELDPNNQVAIRNLEIVRLLSNEPYYGSPQRRLEPIYGESTDMFDAILAELNANLKETHVGVNVGNVAAAVVSGGSSAAFTPIFTDHEESRVQNALAIKGLHDLRMMWDVEAVHRELENTAHVTASPQR